MTTTASKNIVFGKSILNTEDHHYDFRVLADGQRVVNVWHYGDDTAGHGVDMAVSDFVAEYGCEYACKLAWIEYIQSRKEQTPLGQPNTLAPSSTNPLVYNSAGVSVCPGSVIGEGWDYETNYKLAAFALANEVAVHTQLLKNLKAQGITADHLATKNGNRINTAWELLTEGRYSFSGEEKAPLLAASSDPHHPEPYRVYTGAQGRQCDCRDHAQKLDQHGGYCKHCLLLEILLAIAFVWAKQNPAPPVAALNVA